MILVAGDLMMDVLLLPELRKAEQPDGLLLRSGGSAANTAAWIGFLRKPVTFVGCVGADAVGEVLIRELQAMNVNTVVRAVPDLETGAVADEITTEGERVMRSARGANQALSPADILAAARADLWAVHITGYALLSPYRLQILNAAGEVAARCGARLSFDPASVGVIETFGREALLAEMVRCGVDIVLPNSVEALALTGASSIDDAAAQLGECVPTVVVKDGASGALYSSGGEAERVPTTPLRPVDTTGAGDAFNAGL
ncbi:MAG TPA: PfkB family carbohydrate kinase, partial [Chloroflexota bacterium]